MEGREMLTGILWTIHFAKLHAETQGTPSLPISDFAVLRFYQINLTEQSRILIIISKLLLEGLYVGRHRLVDVSQLGLPFELLQVAVNGFLVFP